MDKINSKISSYISSISIDDLKFFAPGILLLLIPIIFRKKIACIITKRLESLLKKLKFNKADRELFSKKVLIPLNYLGYLISLIILNQYFKLDQTYSFIIKLQDSLTVIIVFWIFHASIYLLSIKLKSWKTLLSKEMVHWFLKALKFLIIFLALAAVLEIWGIKVAPILAGLGLFGVAVALGAQDLFKNLIAGVLVLAEKRFEDGDWIKVDGVVEGTVEEIGFRSTKVVRFDKAPVYVPNTKLSDNVVTNFSKMSHRRISFKFGVLYSTNIQQLKSITEKIHQFIIDEERFNTELLPNFVKIESFGSSSIDIMVYCFTENTAWVNWLEAREDLICKIKEIVLAEKSDFAFPTSTIHFGDEDLAFMNTPKMKKAK